MPDLEGRVVVVTGAGGGVGRGIVTRFVEAGATVVTQYRAKPTQAAGAASVSADLRVEEERVRLVETVVDRHGRIDVMVNNAGVQPVTPLTELRAHDVRDVFEVNVIAAFELTRLAASAMPEGGSVIGVASVEAQIPGVGHAHYAASKAALVMHARAAALELGHKGIRVNTVSPGLVDAGDLAARWPTGHQSWVRAAPLGRTITPEAIGDACVFLASDRAAFITGQDLVVDAGMSLARPWG